MKENGSNSAPEKNMEGSEIFACVNIQQCSAGEGAIQDKTVDIRTRGICSV